MLSEYFMLLGGKLGLDTFSMQGVIISLLAIIGLSGAGFAFKGVWGAIGALAIGLLAYLYWNQLWLF